MNKIQIYEMLCRESWAVTLPLSVRPMVMCIALGFEMFFKDQSIEECMVSNELFLSE